MCDEQLETGTYIYCYAREENMQLSTICECGCQFNCGWGSLRNLLMWRWHFTQHCQCQTVWCSTNTGQKRKKEWERTDLNPGIYDLTLLVYKPPGLKSQTKISLSIPSYSCHVVLLTGVPHLADHPNMCRQNPVRSQPVTQDTDMAVNGKTDICLRFVAWLFSSGISSL